MKICVVDDEREVRMSIIQKLSLLYPHEEIFDAGFGHRALETIALIQPDLVFLDIRMPEMDGLDILDRLKSDRPSMHVVIISGYDDFEYARKALQYGAMDYLLKPADRGEIKEIVEKVKRKQRDEFRREFEFFSSKAPEAPLRYEHLELFNISLWFNERQWKTVLFGSVSERIAEFERMPGHIMFAFAAAPRIEGIVVKVEMDQYPAGFRDKASCLPFLTAEIKKLERRLFFGTAASAGAADDSPARAGDRKEAGKKANKLRNLIVAHAVNGQIESLEEALRQWFEQLKRLDLPELRRECAHLMAALDEGLVKPDVIVVEEETFHYWLAWGSKHPTWEELTASIRKLVVSGVHALKRLEARPEEEGAARSWFEQAVKLLETSTDPNLSLESVAEAVNVHPVTLSRMFKQQMGVTFVKYLTGRKLKHAQELLLTTNKRINDISEEIGYGDYRYFRSLFKKEFGYSPSEFRRRNGIAAGPDEAEEAGM
ncbi:two-component system response regulator [Paenibacillus sp. 32O-W]|uniref:response regulator n=1 Tax=Paenibacillus sp. 32O-W TaxID=1695218 RepID=UPI000722CD35|nr:response regulator [Paenibacillus sp. 32O-W]ALS28636.1 two-component system response regulator [Paenibacillus sp. 32O-W]